MRVIGLAAVPAAHTHKPKGTSNSSTGGDGGGGIEDAEGISPGASLGGGGNAGL